MAQTGTRRSRGHIRRVQCGGSDGLLRGCAVVASADGAWAIHVPSAGEFGARREEGLGHEGEKVDRKVTRVEEDELEVRHGKREWKGR